MKKQHENLNRNPIGLLAHLLYIAGALLKFFS